MDKTNPDSVFGSYSGSDDWGNSSKGSWSTSWINLFSGSDLPHFRQIIRDGGNATTDASGFKYEVLNLDEPVLEGTITQLSNSKVYRSKFNGFSANFRPVFGAVGSSPAKADAIALGNYYQSARNVMSAFQGGVFLGELRETIHLLKHPTESIFQLTRSLHKNYRSLLRLNLRNLRELEKAIANLWLEYAFAVRPLIQDAAGAIEAYNRLLGKVVDNDCRGIGEDTFSLLNQDIDQPIWNTVHRTRCRKVNNCVVTVKYYGKVRASVVGAKAGKLSNLGFRLDEFVPTVWELIPFSFLADYFVNIGDIVSASTFVDSNLLWTAKTTHWSSDFNASLYVVNSWPSSYVENVQLQGGFTTRATKFTRSRAVTAGIPPLTFTVPGSGSTRWYNMAALFASFRGLTPLFLSR